MLSKIQHDWPCEHANKCNYCCNASCQHDLDVFCSEIIHGLRKAAVLYSRDSCVCAKALLVSSVREYKARFNYGP